MGADYELTVYGRPQPRGSKIAQPIYTKGKVPLMKDGRVVCVARDDNIKSGPWMSMVKSAAIAAYGGRGVIDRPCILSAQFYFNRPKYHIGTGRNAGMVKSSAPENHAVKPDLAKLVRAIEDAITESKCMWKDDSRVFSYLGTRKDWTMGRERVEIQIYFR